MKNITKFISLFIRISFGLGMIFLSIGSKTFADQNDMCIPQLLGLTGIPDVSDGDILNDNGWNKATQFNLNASTGVHRTAQLFSGVTSSDVYLGLVIDTPTPDVNNTIVIAMGGEDCEADWKIHFKPWDSAISEGDSQTPYNVNYWRNSCVSGNNWNLPGAVVTNPGTDHWLYQNTRFSKNGTRWSVEIKIPKIASSSTTDDTGVFFPPTDTFKIYVNVLSTSTILSTVTQAVWPQGSTIVGPGFLTQLTPIAADWGTVSLNPRPECTGLLLAWNQIGTKNTPSSTMIRPDTMCPTDNTTPLGSENIFFADVQNDMSAVAEDVLVTFSLANWGIPGASDWGAIPPGTNGTTMVQDVEISGTEFTRNWALTPAQSCDYAPPRDHQCMKVEMDSENASVRFKNRGITRNMDFVTASRFQRSAEISAKGYGNPPEGEEEHEFMLVVDTDEYQIQNKDTKKLSLTHFSNVKSNSSRIPDVISNFSFANFIERLQRQSEDAELFLWEVRGYLKMGNSININNHWYQNTRLIGGFGYLALHDGAVREWTQDFSGNGLVKLDDNTFTIRIPPEQVATVTTTIDAKEQLVIVPGESGLPWWLLILVFVLLLFLFIWSSRTQPASP